MHRHSVHVVFSRAALPLAAIKIKIRPAHEFLERPNPILIDLGIRLIRELVHRQPRLSLGHRLHWTQNPAAMTPGGVVKHPDPLALLLLQTATLILTHLEFLL